MNAKDKLKLGAWYSIEFGHKRKTVCIVEISDEVLVIEHLNWLLSDAQVATVDEFFGAHFNPRFIGYGTRRWFMGWIRRQTDCFGSLYTFPTT